MTLELKIKQKNEIKQLLFKIQARKQIDEHGKQQKGWTTYFF